MNIQQALNQGLLTGGAGLYFASQTLEQGKQAANAEYQAASKDKIESKKNYEITEAVRGDENKERLSEELKQYQPALQSEVIKDAVANDPEVRAAKERQAKADARFNRADKKLARWNKNPGEVNNLREIHKADYENMEWGLWDDRQTAIQRAREAREVKAVQDALAFDSQSRQQETYANQARAMEERKKILNSKNSQLWGNDDPKVLESLINDVLGNERKTEE